MYEMRGKANEDRCRGISDQAAERVQEPMDMLEKRR